MTDFPYLSNCAADLRLLGHPNILNGFCQFNSSSRMAMVNGHLSQAMIIDKPEFNKLFTGVEHNFLEYRLDDSAREFDCEIVAIIPKYQSAIYNQSIDNCPQVYVIVLTLEPNNVRHLDYFTIDRYVMGTNDFGYITNVDNDHRIRVGEILDKGTVICRSNAVNGNKYSLGLNLNIAYGSFPETIEDAFIISQSTADKMQTVQVSKRIINCRMDRKPLNINGNEFVEKFLPDIGSYVREDGALCAFRPSHWATQVADSDPVALRQSLPLQDDIIYVDPGAKIVDLTFNINRSKINDCYDQALSYMKNNTKCWESIYSTYQKHRSKYRLTSKMSTLVKTAIYRMIAQGTRVPYLEEEFRKEMRNFDIEGENNQIVDFLQVIVHYTIPRKVSSGSKITDFHGSKGIVATVYPDDWMPIDEYGIRADMMVDMTTSIGRTNLGQMYETGINRISEFVRRKCEAINISKGSEPAFEALMEWYGDVNPNYEKRIREVCLTTKTRKGLVTDAIETSPKIWVPPYLDTLTPSDKSFYNALENIRKWADKWGCKPSRIRYKTPQNDGTVKEVVTEAKFSIGSKYIIHLNKLPEITSTGPASVSHLDIPTKPNFMSKNFPVSTSPYRYGEDEFRIIAMGTDIRELTRLQNMMANSPKGVKTVINSLLLMDNPTKIDRIKITNGSLMKSSSVIKLFHSVAATMGIESKNTKVTDFEIPDELAESIWSSEVIGPDTEGSSFAENEELAYRKAETKRSKMKNILVDITDDDE